MTTDTELDNWTADDLRAAAISGDLDPALCEWFVARLERTGLTTLGQLRHRDAIACTLDETVNGWQV